MTSAATILAELKSLGSEGYRKILRNHGAREPLFGVKISELKKIQKRIKKNHDLALALYQSGNYDAMYLAGLIVDDRSMAKKDLQEWVAGAYCAPIAESTVAWVAAESLYGWEIGLKWIDSKQELIAAAGWATLSGLTSIKADADLDLDELKGLLHRVDSTIHASPNRVRGAMNSFVIHLGSHVKALTADAMKAARRIGTVTIDMGDTACKVPDAFDCINKVKTRGTIGTKRKTVKC
jgi:3-methyladenine DNA glycosylase AlkD